MGLKDENIRESFQNVKKDIDSLNYDIYRTRAEIAEMRKGIVQICDILEKITFELKEIKKMSILVQHKTEKQYSAHQHLNQATPTHFPAHTWPLNPLKPQNMAFSIGNKGVPTDRQTNQQTDNQLENKPKNILEKPLSISPIEDAAKILDSLDSLKKEIRIKFKQLTDQEVLVFSTLYQIEEDQGPLEYKVLAQKLGLTESSIRDYIGKLIKKGIPVEKKRINNKQIQLSISQSLKKVASLSTILQLRDI